MIDGLTDSRVVVQLCKVEVAKSPRVSRLTDTGVPLIKLRINNDGLCPILLAPAHLRRNVGISLIGPGEGTSGAS